MDADVAFAQVEAGERHTCALTTEGEAFCWGRNTEGQLGIGTTAGPERCAGVACASRPMAVGTDLRFRDIDVGQRHTCAAATTGGVYCWGADAAGELGTGQLDEPSAVPIEVGLSGVDFVTVSSMQRSTCALSSGGSIYCWGENRFGEAGVPVDQAEQCPGPGTPVPCVSTPARIVTAALFTALSVGAAHACARTDDDRGLCWGSNGTGALGIPLDSVAVRCPDGSTAYCATPLEISGERRFTSLSAGGTHSCGIDRDGIALCWGSQVTGQVGDCSSATSRFTPVPVCADIDFAMVAAGGSHSCGFVAGGQGYCWGDNDVGALGSATFTSLGPVLIAPWVDVIG